MEEAYQMAVDALGLALTRKNEGRKKLQKYQK